MSKIHVATKDGNRFEYELDELDTLWREGTISREALYWREGMSDWLPLQDLLDEPPQSKGSSSFQFVKDPRPLTQLLIAMLWVSLGFEVISIIGESMQIALLERIYTASESEIAANDTRQQMIGIGYLVVFIVTAIVFLKWIYRANLNARQFTSKEMDFTPGWSIGYYFIPVMNLYKPYQAMREIWQVSEASEDWQNVKVSPILAWWWGLWIISNVIGQIIFRIPEGESVQDFINAGYVSLFSSIIGIPLCLLAIQLVRRITKKQELLVEG